MPILETERLILRDFVLSDWDALNAFLSDPSVTRFMHFASWDEQKRRQWLTALVQEASNPQRDAYNWAITLRSNGLLIGWLILGRSRHARDPGMGECGCGYALNQHYWGQGYMPETLQAALTYAFTVLGTRLIHAECARENTASARVMQKCGMQYEGTMYDDDGLGNWEHRDRYVITAQTETHQDAKGQITMITFTRGDLRFNYRITGVAICDGKVLLQKPAEESFWFLPGGRAEFQETAEETLRREMREELHTDITVERLLWVVENFFQHDGRKFHELGLYFFMSFPKDSPVLDTGQTIIVQEAVQEAGYEFIFQWHPLDSLKGIPLHPSFLQTALQKLPDGTEHIVQKS